MSRLSELIAELCPDGVEYKALYEIGSSQKGVRVVRKQLSDDGLYPVYQNSLTPLGYYESTNRNAGMPFVIGAGAASQIGYCDVDWWAADDCFTFDIPGDVAIGRYVYYCLLNQQDYLRKRVRKASIPRLARSVVEKLRIPVPPIEVQREIVRILDEYTVVHDELVGLLYDEIQVRNNQCNSLQNSILSLDNAKLLTLGTLGSFYSGLTGKTKADFGDGFPFVSYMQVYGNLSLPSDGFGLVSVGVSERQNTIHKGDVLITVSSENREDAGMTCVVTDEPENDTYLNSFCTGWRPNNDVELYPDYMKHLLRSDAVRKQIRLTTNGVTRFNISKPKLAKVKLSIPDYSVQVAVAKQLDTLVDIRDELVSSIREEILYREQSLSAIRNKLLELPEKVS